MMTRSCSVVGAVVVAASVYIKMLKFQTRVERAVKERVNSSEKKVAIHTCKIVCANT
jgi:hypothetical protein